MPQLVGAVVLHSLAIVPAQEVAEQGAEATAEQVAECRRLIAQLGPDDVRAAAFSRLLGMGEVALPALMDAIAGTDVWAERERFADVLVLSAELTGSAETILEALWDRTRLIDGEALQRTLAAIVDLAPFVGADAVHYLYRAQIMASERMNDDGLEAAVRERFAETAVRAMSLRREKGETKGLPHAGRSARELIDILESGTSFRPYDVEAAAALYARSDGRTPALDALAIKALAARLRTDCLRAQIKLGTTWVWCGPRSHRRIAASLLRLDPEPAIAQRAHVYLLEHGRRHERWRALDELRKVKSEVSGYERALRLAVADATTPPDLRLEAATSLGMLPRLGSSTNAALRQLARSDDRALAEGAQAALQAVARRRE